MTVTVCFGLRPLLLQLHGLHPVLLNFCYMRIAIRSSTTTGVNSVASISALMTVTTVMLFCITSTLLRLQGYFMRELHLAANRSQISVNMGINIGLPTFTWANSVVSTSAFMIVTTVILF